MVQPLGYEACRNGMLMLGGMAADTHSLYPSN